MESEIETEEEGNLEVMKLPVLATKPNSHSYSMSSPIHSSIAASVPFSWEQEPGKPKQSSSSSSSSSSSRVTSPSSSSPGNHKSLELPPRLHSPITVLDGPYNMGRSRRLDSPSFRMMVKSSNECYGSFRSDMSGELEGVAEEELKQQNTSESLDPVKKRGRLRFFGFGRRKTLKGKTEFGRGSYVFPKEEEEEEEDKRFEYGDGISSSRSSRFSEVKISSFSRTGSLSTLPAPPSSSKSHFWTNVCAGLKQVVPWKHKKTTTA